MTWTKQQQGPDEPRYILDQDNRFIARMDREATDSEWSLARAAPDLYDACEAIVKAWANLHVDPGTPVALARAAFAKANA